MIYQELLALLQEEAKSAGFRMDRNAWLVLCDVVELHKPEPLDERGDVCLTCCPDLLTLYPCPTIQTIQKELA